MHRDRDADAAVVLRQRCYFGERLTFIDRFVERGAIRSLWCASAESAKSSAPTLCSCEDHFRHVEGVLNITGPVCVFRSQRILPGFAAVSRSIDAPTVVLRIALR